MATVHHDTIRHTDCQMLVWNKNSKRCKSCSLYRNTLRVLSSRNQQANGNAYVRVDPRSKMNDRYRTPSELAEKTSRTKRELKTARSEIRKLSAALESAVQRDGLTVDERTHTNLVSIMKENSDKVKSRYHENSFPFLFWQQQLLAGSQAKASGIR